LECNEFDQNSREHLPNIISRIGRSAFEFAVFVKTKMHVYAWAIGEEGADDLMAPFQSNDESGYWDFFQVGGRWTGALDDTYDSRKDPRNMEPCLICKGSKDKVATCRACQGSGTGVKWPTGWAPFDGDTTTVGHVKQLLTTGKLQRMPGTAVTFNGWQEDMEKDKWLELLDRYEDSTPLFVVDYHC